MSEAQSAGMQDYWRGGTEHSPADRAAAEHAMAAYPGLAASVQADVTQPVAVTLVSVLHLIEDSAGPHAIVAELMSALPAGSFLSLTHVASDLEPEAMAEMTRRVNEHLARPATPRDHVTVTRFFAGLDLVPPGLVRVPQWRPDSPEEALSPSAQWGGVARKPS
jgi:hypothetical protein